MIPDQKAILEAIESKLSGQDLNLQDLDETDFQACYDILMPRGSFTPEQREFIARWFLEGNGATEASIAALCPTNSRYPARRLDGRYLWSIDLLSDAFDSGRLSALLPILVTLPLVRVLPEEWPTPEEEEA